MTRLLLVLSLLVAGCGEDKKQIEPITPNEAKVLKLKGQWDEMRAQALDIRHDPTGWLEPHGCDGMIWAGRYAAAPKVEGVDILAAERDGKPGSFDRRPTGPCWDPDKGDVGSKSTWSRDMAVCGLFPWAWRHRRLDALERHADYGKNNNWYMGEPLSDGRTIYSPAVIGLLYQMIYTLGGEDNANRVWPGSYKSGLTDYQAHLQVCSIWLRGEIAKRQGDAVPKKPDGEYSLLSISERMYLRLKEHYERVPQDPFYAYAYGLYTGDMMPAVNACLEGEVGGYVRCDNPDHCRLAHRIFSCGLTLEKLGAL